MLSRLVITFLYKAWAAANDSCPQAMSWAGVAETNSTHNQLSRSQLPQVNSPYSLEGGGEPQQPQDKMLSIPNYRNANQNKETSNPTSQNGHPHKSINNKCGTVPGGKGIPLHVGRWECTLATATPNDSL